MYHVVTVLARGGAGVVGPDMLSTLDAELSAVHADAARTGCRPPTLIAYGHHTLSTLAYGSETVNGAISVRIADGCEEGGDGCIAGGTGGTSSRQRDHVQPDLGDIASGASGASARSSSSKFRPSADTRVEDVLRDWDVAAYLCGHLHDTFGLRVHRMYPKQGSRAPGTCACACFARSGYLSNI
jgi:hypothetical protein